MTVSEVLRDILEEFLVAKKVNKVAVSLVNRIELRLAEEITIRIDLSASRFIGGFRASCWFWLLAQLIDSWENAESFDRVDVE